MAETKKISLFDIAANLTDSMYKGIYNSKSYHAADLDAVLHRASEHGVSKMLVLCSGLDELDESLSIFREHDNIYFSIGCHPTRSGMLENSSEEYFSKVDQLLNDCKNIVAYGEIGLDFDRLHFCDKETQIKWFKIQLKHALSSDLPIYFHMRAAAKEFFEILRECNMPKNRGVLHCFTGNIEDMNVALSFGLSIGLTGCSLKSEQNINVVKEIPLGSIMLETDCPWCEIRPSHASYKFIRSTFQSNKKEKYSSEKFVKGRQEPAHLRQVAEVVAGIKGVDVATIARITYNNATKLFKRIPV